MVAGWPHGAERIGGVAAQHRIDRSADRARSPQHRFAGPRRDNGIGVEPKIAVGWNGRQYPLHMVQRMNARDLFDAGARRLAPVEPIKAIAGKRLQHRRQAGRTFGMRAAWIVFEACRMRIQDRAHVAAFA